MKKEFSEKLLLYKIQTKKDPEAFAVLYDMYVERIYRFISFKVSSTPDVEDITSAVFLKTWDYLIQETPRPIKSFSGLIYSITRNAVVDYYRARSGEHATIPLEDVQAERIGQHDGGLHQVEISLEHEKLLRTVKQMKQEYQEVILLKYIDEYSASEIARILGKSHASVRVTIHRAVKVLKRLNERGISKPTNSNRKK